MRLSKRIAARHKGLSKSLKQSRIDQKPEDFVDRAIKSSLMVSVVLSFSIFYAFKSFWGLFLFPLFFFIIYNYIMKTPFVMLEKRKKEITKEIIFASRFLIIELDSGVTPYEAFKNMSTSYKAIGPYFASLVKKVDLGTSMEDAIVQVIEDIPSDDLKKILWQVLNSIKTGAEVVDSLRIVVEQIAREQQLAVADYGKKLNPLAMFYMLGAVIAPSLGITMLIIIVTFMGLRISLVMLLVLSLMMGFVQFMFLSIIKSLRPPVDL